MKLYDKIYVPIPKSELTDTARSLSDFFMNKPLKAIPNVIVLTVEELANLWNAGHSAGMEDAGAKLKKPAVDFDTYLASKGITIEG